MKTTKPSDYVRCSNRDSNRIRPEQNLEPYGYIFPRDTFGSECLEYQAMDEVGQAGNTDCISPSLMAQPQISVFCLMWEMRLHANPKKTRLWSIVLFVLICPLLSSRVEDKTSGSKRLKILSVTFSLISQGTVQSQRLKWFGNRHCKVFNRRRHLGVQLFSVRRRLLSRLPSLHCLE
jgi:hypothetical protein